MGRDHRTIDDHVWELASRQHGLISFGQLLDLGVSRDAVQSRVAGGRFERIHQGVYRMAGAPATRAQKILAACQSAGPWALASHRTAASLWSLSGIVATGTEVVVPRPQRFRRDPFVVHQSKDLRGVDASQVNGIPVTSPVRTLLDLGAVVHRYRVEQALDDAIQRKLVTLDALQHRFLEVARKGRRGVGPMRPLLEERLGVSLATDSAFEASTVRLVRQAGLPPPMCQFPVDLGDITIYLDLAWPDRRLVIECDSLAHHFAAHRLRWDDRRQNALVLLGWTVLRVTWLDVIERAPATIRLLQQAWDRTQPAALDRSGDV